MDLDPRISRVIRIILESGTHGRDFWANQSDFALLDLTRVAERAAAGVLRTAGLEDAAGARPLLGLARARMLLWYSPSGEPRLVLTPAHPCSGRAQHVGDLVVPGQLQALALAVSAVLPGHFPFASEMPVLQSGSALRRVGGGTARLWLCCRACEFLLTLDSGRPAGRAPCRGRCGGSELEREDMHSGIHRRLHNACVAGRFTHTELDFILWPGTLREGAQSSLRGLRGAARDAELRRLMDEGAAAAPQQGWEEAPLVDDDEEELLLLIDEEEEEAEQQ